MIVQAALPRHAAAIRQLHVSVFPSTVEADLVEQLQADGDSVISLVAMDDDVVVGHVLFSRMGAPFRAIGLAPVSVASDHRKRGIAAALIEEGIARARTDGEDAVFVLGEPDYYQRFGFSVEQAQRFESPYSGPYFMVLRLRDGALDQLSGPVDYARAFSALG